MQLLVKAKDVLGLEGGYTPDMQEDLFKTIHQEFESVDKDFRVSFSDKVVTGSSEPEKLLEIIHGWNDTIKQNLVKAVNRFNSNPEQFALDSHESHELSLAARAADDHFSAYGSHGLFADNGCGFSMLSVILPPWYIQDIEQSPGEWLVVTLLTF